MKANVEDSCELLPDDYEDEQDIMLSSKVHVQHC